MKVTRDNNAAQKRWLAGLILMVFSTSCATTGVPTDKALQQSSDDPSSLAISSAAQVADVTGVQVLAEGSGKASIVVTADGARVDYASFAEHAPPRLVNDPRELPHYRVEFTRNSLQTLVSTEVSQPAPVVQEPTKLEQAAEPVVSPIEPAEEGVRGVKTTVPAIVAKQEGKIDQPAPPSKKLHPLVTVTPWISDVSPTTPVATGAAQPFTINGGNFVSGATVTLRTSGGAVYTKRAISSQSATQIVINPNFGTISDTWTVEVINPSGLSSGWFTASAPATSAEGSTKEPVVSPVEGVEARSVQAAQPPAVSPPTAKEETPPPLLKNPTALAAAKRPSREASGGAGQEAPPLPSAAAERPIAPAPVTPQIAAANKRLMLDFKDADLDEIVWKVIREASGLNIVLAHKLAKEKRKVTVRLDNVEWRQALDVILRTLDLSYEQDGNVIYVGSKAEIQKVKDDRAKDIEDAARRTVRVEEAAALKTMRIEEEKRKGEEAKREERRYAEEPPCTKVLHLAHTKAADVKKHLQRLKTQRGSIELEETTNTLIVNDVESVCLKMAALAKELDMPPKDPFVTKLLPFNYAKAADLKIHLTALKTTQGSVIVDERSSRIIVKDLPETVERIETFLKQIDLPTPQVLIEARIVEASRSFSQSVGIQWGGAGIPTTAESKTGVTTFGGSGSPGSVQFPTLTPGTGVASTTGGGVPFLGPVPLALNLPAIAAGANPFVLGATIGSLANRYLVGVQLSAAEREGKIRTLSSPRVATQDNEEAEIKQGTQVPYTTIDSSGRTVVQFQDAFIKLKVKPHITPDGRVSMKVEAERSFAGDIISGPFGFVFPINTRKATTNILVQNGSTVVIGGLLQSSESIGTDRVPLFGRIPGLGWLFKRQSIGPDERVELLIFLTPSILHESRP